MTFIITKPQFPVIATVSVKYFLCLFQSKIKRVSRKEQYHNMTTKISQECLPELCHATPNSMIIFFGSPRAPDFDGNFG